VIDKAVLRKYGEGEERFGVPSDVRKYTGGVVPLWLRRSFQQAAYSLTVACEIEYLVRRGQPNATFRRERVVLMDLLLPHNTTRDEHVDALVGLCDLIAMYSGVEYCIVGGEKTLAKIRKPKRRRR
jgi:hypothetical protein